MRNDPAKHASVALLACEEVSPFEFGVACEIFGYDRSDMGVPWYRFSVCAARPGPVSAGTGFTLYAPHGLDELRSADMVIVPPTAAYDLVATEVLDALRCAHRGGARIVSLCTGAFVLAAAGLLDGRIATTHWVAAERLAHDYPEVVVDPNVLYVDDGDILTSAGSAASIDLCLHIVRTDFGADVANRVARHLVVPPHRDGGQAQYIESPIPSAVDADRFGATLVWLDEHLADPVTIDDLAERAAMSPRTFARRFRSITGATPYQWLLHQRVALAQRLLEGGDASIDVVAGASGFGTATNLRKHFHRVLRTSPQSYRRSFRAG
ncbi:MAG: thij/pfpi protein [Acidimicrobiaceae bacterium]|jgi:transcriptional regulator GlxA family with amidase domain|nr:thij/pfpi protein [Acidimicrobiaceae bacterium]